MLKTHAEYMKAVDLTVKIGGLNSRVQDWLFQHTITTGRDTQLAMLSDELDDCAHNLRELLFMDSL